MKIRAETGFRYHKGNEVGELSSLWINCTDGGVWKHRPDVSVTFNRE